MRSKFHLVSLVLLVFGFSSCGRRVTANPVAELLAGKRAAVFVFLAPDCPLSQNYTLTLNNLDKEFAGKGLGFYGIFSGDGITKDAMDTFVSTYHVGFRVVLDSGLKFADYFAATTTPEAFVTDSAGQTLYKGAIDDWAPELGAHRTVITHHYLEDAIEGVTANKPVQVRQTPAVGCFIERKNSD